jgi:hypothetical protein
MLALPHRPVLLAIGALAAVTLVGGAAVPANAAVALSVSVTAPVVTLPVGDGFRDAESLLVTASDATTAAVTLQRTGGEASTVAQGMALPAGTTTVAVPTAALAAGAYTATVLTADGASATGTFTVERLVSAVTRVAVRRSLSTVYPAKDGYRDAVVFTVTPSLTAGPSTVAVTGTAKLTRAGRTAKVWKLHRGTNRLVWNGRTAGAVQPGRYTLTVKAKGPQGATRTARSSVTVSPKRLVARTVTVTKEASAALQRFKGYDGGANDCGYVGAFVLCSAAAAQDGAPYAAVVGGTVAVPEAVRTATRYGKPDLRLALRTTKLRGSATWGYGVGTAHTTRSVRQGTTTGSRVRWSADSATTTIYVALDDSTELAMDRFVFTYRYRVLV